MDRMISRSPILAALELAAPAASVMLAMSVICRASVLHRALVYDPTLRPGMLWKAAPVMLAWDVIAAVGFGVCLAPLEHVRKRARKRWPWAAGQIGVCTLAALILGVQYRTYAEIGFFPSLMTFRKFLAPGSPFLDSVRSYGDAKTLSSLGFVLLAPALIWTAAQRLRRLAAALVAILALTVPVAFLVRPPVPAAPLAMHPFSKLPPASFELPTGRDPEVSPLPPSMASICGLSKRERCGDSFDRLAGGNLVLIVLESTSHQYVFVDGAWRFKNLRRMAEHGVRFERYYAPAGASNPALYTILTGRHVIPSDEWWHTPTDRTQDALPAVLTAAGYDCGFFMSGCFRYFFDERLYRGMSWQLCVDGDDLSRILHLSDANRDPDGHCIDDAILVRQALDWMKERHKEGGRWACVVYPGVPHTPYQFCSQGPHALHTGSNLTAFQRYENQLAYVDHQIGLIYDYLLSIDFFSHGYLAITGDHGEAFNQHPNNLMHGTNVYDENLRVPLLVVNPKRLRPGLCRTLGSHIDLGPTLLDLVGLPPGPAMVGRSLLSEDRPDLVFLSAAHDAVKVAVVDWPYKYILPSEGNTDELYHLEDDAAEKRNLAATDSSLAGKYRSWIKSFMYHKLTPEDRRDLPPAKRAFYEGKRLVAVHAGPVRAAQSFREALQIDPEYAEARDWLADCIVTIGLNLGQLGDWPAAETQLAEAVRLRPWHIRSRALWADALVRLGRCERAAAALREGISSGRQNPDLLMRLAWLHSADSDYAGRNPAEAESIVRGLPALDKLPPDAAIDQLIVRAGAAAARGRFEEAIAVLTEASNWDRSLARWDRLSRGPRIQKHLAAYQAKKLPPVAPFPGGLPGLQGTSTEQSLIGDAPADKQQLLRFVLESGGR